MDLYETFTHDVCRSTVEHYKEIFWLLAPPKIWRPKTIYFQRLCNPMATLRANIFVEEQDIDNQEMTLDTMKGPLHRSKIS